MLFFRPVELTLEAALRDLDAKKESSRLEALRSLAPALLRELGLASGTLNCAREHARGAEVIHRFEQVLSAEKVDFARGFALLGLARLGEVEVVASLAATLRDDSRDGIAAFVRECALIAASELVGMIAAAPLHGAPTDSSNPLSQLEDFFIVALGDERSEVRFQAYDGVAQLQIHGRLRAEFAVDRIVAAAEQESDPRLTAAACEALAQIRPIVGNGRDFIRATAAQPLPAPPWIFEDARLVAHFAALEALAQVGDALALAPLSKFLQHHRTRDRALEMLALLVDSIPADLRDKIADIASERRWWPGLSQVRAAYVLFAAGDPRGARLLDRFDRSLRREIREASVRSRELVSQMLTTPTPANLPSA
jgi:hypothetical protein